MGCKLVLLSFLVTRSVLVDSYPNPKGDLDGIYQSNGRYGDPIFFQSRSNVNPQWSRNQGITQTTQNPVFIRPFFNRQNYRDNEIQNTGRNNFVRPANGYGFGQQANNHDNVTPRVTLQNGFKPQWSGFALSTPAPRRRNQFSWNARFNPQQNNNYGSRGNSFAQSYASSYSNQDNYGQKPPQYQSAAMITPKPVESFNSQGWLPQNQFNSISTPRSVNYIPWPIADNQQAQIVEVYEPNGFNIPTEIIPIANTPEPVQSDVLELILVTQSPIENSPESQTVTPKNYLIVHVNGSYEKIDNLNDIVMDENNVAHIKSRPPPNQVFAIVEVEESTEIQPSVEVPYDTGISKIPRDTERSTNSYDNFGILQNSKYSSTQMPIEDTTYDMSYFKPEYIMHIQSTTETIDSTMNSPPQDTISKGNINTENNSYIMQTTTKNYVGNAPGRTTSSETDDTTESTKLVTSDSTNTINSTTDSITNSADDISTEQTTDNTIHSAADSSTLSTTEKSIFSTINSNIVNIISTTSFPDNFIFDTSTDTYFTVEMDDKRQDHVFTTQSENDRYFHTDFDDIYNQPDQINQETRYNTNTKTSHQSNNHFEDIENYFDDLDTMQYDVPDWNSIRKGYENNNQDNNEPSQSSDENDDIQARAISSASSSVSQETQNTSENEESEKDNPPTTREPQLREDRRIDASELKASVSGPAVWFRPDDTFWDKVTKGEQAYDALTIYDINCKPKLIERTTTIHHHVNGTRTVEYVETIWDEPDAKNPREVRTKREFLED